MRTLIIKPYWSSGMTLGLHPKDPGSNPGKGILFANIEIYFCLLLDTNKFKKYVSNVSRNFSTIR